MRRLGIIDRSDLVFYAAIALLPVDGLRVGLSMPFWNPVSPVLFAAYVVLNARMLPRVMRVYRFWMWFPVVLLAMSVFGWATVAFHPLRALVSFVAVMLGLACLASLDIALRIKRLPVTSVVTVLVVAYWCAFAVGVLEFVSIKAHLNTLHTWFMRMMQRNYVAARPQFLFAEPSYIGMHLFGVLLPAYWLTRDRRIAVLVPCFAFGAVAMGAGSRIVVDTLVAAVACLVALAPWRRFRRATLWRGAIAAVCVFVVATILAVATNPRLFAIWRRGLWNGDASMSARLFRSLSPMLAGFDDPAHLLFGFGAGNLGEAMRRGFPHASAWVVERHGSMTAEMSGLAHVADSSAFSMNAYVSIVAEFGLFVLVALVVALLWQVTRNRRWDAVTVAWLLLLAYLYCQYEAYAFYAFWLFIWATGQAMSPTSPLVADDCDPLRHRPADRVDDGWR
ncbi:hypothetical protein Uis4E_1385 [Bifidobacterium parmae]|uniref:Uncharacterized protein n=2 Tax=Bifidobacterium parmae TaxID=361854 RepID=A0A2N5J0G2_9BIFI|nr:hypothetical protein Uis4E_1385 [Bifidobacterium parmae]